MEWLMVLVSLIGFLLASYFDLRTREVPDPLSHSLILIGIGLRLFWSLEDISYFLYCLPVLLGLGGVSYLLYKAGQWGGGDVKLMIASSFLLGYFPKKGFFILPFFVNLIVFGTFYSVLYTLAIGLKNGFRSTREQKLIASCGMLLSFFLFKFLPREVGILPPLTILVASFLPMLKDIEQKFFVKEVPPEKLTEGDWLVEPIRVGKLRIEKKGEGLSKKEIEILRKSKIKRVKIREGVPFVPAFLLSLLLTYFLPHQYLGILGSTL